MIEASKKELLAQASDRTHRASAVLLRGQADMRTLQSRLTREQHRAGEHVLREALLAADRVTHVLSEALGDADQTVGKGGAN